ncbi:MAG: DUF192 domain-containing protein [Nanoarchaeota archaeon]|nr:DUF192 domain-containing protein [Nanoarchaeota archaeon]MBU1445301.1 DUF192 domain-containing protein [Nanoarchaeota archaeon]MBU2420497.1 DUF192 domain-containing protein [Nanoarchaeota archaeon]MBU2475078.1 DUF192 domain-containing protein [Nanoarchaeota archaeon]
MKIKAKICRNPFGLMFRGLKKGDSIVLECGEGIFSAAIHMLFVFYSLDIVWLDKDHIVVDKKTVKPFTLFAYPKRPAKYIVEMRKGFSKDIKIGDKIEFI